MDLDPTKSSLLGALMETLQSHESETLRQLPELVFNAAMKAEREKVALSGRKKLKKLDEWIKATRNSGKLSEIWHRFRSKLNGSVRYYGISHQTRYAEIYLTKATGIIFK